MLLVSCKSDYGVGGPAGFDPADRLVCGFSPVRNSKMKVYDCNPVFAGVDDLWSDSITSIGLRTQTVLGQPLFQIWYTSDYTDEPGWGLGYAASSDGTTWTTHGSGPVMASAPNRWDQDAITRTEVVWDDEAQRYVMIYQGIHYGEGAGDHQFGLGVMASDDGVVWNYLNGGDMLLDLAEPLNGVDVCWPMGLNFVSGDGFQGFLGAGTEDKQCDVYSFSSASLEGEIEFSTSPLLRGGPENYDEQGMLSVAVVQYKSTFYMFYVGFQRWTEVEGQGIVVATNSTLNLATSTDGVVWSKHPDNPIQVSLNDSNYVSSVGAQVIGNRIHLWITDYYPKLGKEAVGYYLYEPDAPTSPW